MSAGMANVTSDWVDGNLVFYDGSKNIIMTINGASRKVTFPSGSDIDLTQMLDGADVKNNAASNVIGSIPVIFQVPIAAGALGDTDVVMTHKVRVIDAWLVLKSAGVSTTTLTVKNGATAITNAMAASGSDTALVRAATIDDAQHEIAAAGTLRVTSATGASQPDAVVYVSCVRVA